MESTYFRPQISRVYEYGLILELPPGATGTATQ